MRKFTKDQKTAGGAAIKKLSAKAKENFWETDLLSVYEYEENGEIKYACTGAFEKEGLTLQELEETLEDMVVTYHIIDKNDYEHYYDLKHFTYEELKKEFDPREVFDPTELPDNFQEMCERWEEIHSLSTLEDYLIWQNDGCMIPYRFEEDLVENIEEKERINRWYYSAERYEERMEAEVEWDSYF